MTDDQFKALLLAVQQGFTLVVGLQLVGGLLFALLAGYWMVRRD